MYFYYKKPILGITNPNSILEEELINSGTSVCYYGQPEQVANYLYRALNNYDSLNTFDREYWKRFTVENVSFLYKQLLSRIINK